MRKENATFKTKFISESGSYLINSDYFAFVELKDYACYCIADGIDTVSYTNMTLPTILRV